MATPPKATIRGFIEQAYIMDPTNRKASLHRQETLRQVTKGIAITAGVVTVIALVALGMQHFHVLPSAIPNILSSNLTKIAIGAGATTLVAGATSKGIRRHIGETIRKDTGMPKRPGRLTQLFKRIFQSKQYAAEQRAKEILRRSKGVRQTRRTSFRPYRQPISALADRKDRDDIV